MCPSQLDGSFGAARAGVSRPPQPRLVSKNDPRPIVVAQYSLKIAHDNAGRWRSSNNWEISEPVLITDRLAFTREASALDIAA